MNQLFIILLALLIIGLVISLLKGNMKLVITSGVLLALLVIVITGSRVAEVSEQSREYSDNLWMYESYSNYETGDLLEVVDNKVRVTYKDQEPYSTVNDKVDSKTFKFKNKDGTESTVTYDTETEEITLTNNSTGTSIKLKD